jgi:hypothetical protein
VRLAIGYLNATINRITRILELEIETHGCCQTRRNPPVDRYGSGFGTPRCSRSGFWTGFELNWTVLVVRTRTAGALPRPIAKTTLILTFHCTAPQSFPQSTNKLTESSFSIEIIAIFFYYVYRWWSWTSANISMLWYDAIDIPTLINQITYQTTITAPTTCYIP